MHENSGNSVIYYAHYTEGGVNKTGLTVTITVYEVIRDGTKTEVVSDGACTEIGDGLYRYLLASGTVDAAAEYVAVFHTATDTVDAQDIPAMWVIDRAGTEKLDTGITLADDAITAASVKADAVTKLQANLALEATLTAIKGAGWTGSYPLETIGIMASSIDDTLTPTSGDLALIIEAILADTNELQTDLVNGGRLDLLIDSIITHLTDIKGSGWTDETLAAIDVLIDAIKAKTDLIPATPAVADEYDAALAAIKAETALIVEDTGTTIPATITTIDNEIAVIDGIVDDILVDTGTTLDALIKDVPTNTELATALGTADDAVLAAVAAAKVVIDDIHDTDLPAVKTETAAIKAKTDNLPADPADDSDIDAQLAAIKAETALIVEDTGTTLPATLATIAGYTDGIAGDVWSHAKRTLTIPAVAMSDPEDGTTLTLYKDADINIEFTGLTIPTGAKKVVFTIKDNLDDADTAAALQATYQLTAVPAETHTLNYINSATPPTLTNPVTFTVTTDSVEFDMTAAAAYYLPRYERGYLKWDLKLITATSVQILQQGLVQILGTSTRTVA